MPGADVSAKEVAALASLPSREELLAKLMGTMQAPIAKFVRTLNEVPGEVRPHARRGSRSQARTPSDRATRFEDLRNRSKHMSAVQD